MALPYPRAGVPEQPTETSSGRLVAYVQPIVALTTGMVTGYEALMRFRDPTVPIDSIFEKAWADGDGPYLEATALVAALRLPDRPPSTYLAVNVSPRAVEAASVVTALDRDLTGVVVELTEAHYVPVQELKRIAAWLRERNAAIAIDDVGTGYAGLERIIGLSPDLIKLDRSLVMQLRDDPVCRAMVESLVRFASRCGAGVCAEGIETHEQLEVVAELDISFGQGFLFGRPAPRWATPSKDVVAAAVNVHRQALNATPKQSLFLDDYVLLERLADRFSEAEELEDVHHAVAGLNRLLESDEVELSLVDAATDRVYAISHDDWAPLDAGYQLHESPMTQWVLDTRRAAQVLATDPNADAREVQQLRSRGYAALLLVPATTNGQTVAVLSFYRHRAAPWTLTQIRLARIGASQLASTLDRLLLSRGAPAPQ